MKICPHCKAKFSDDNAFCSKCGNKLKDLSAYEQEQEKLRKSLEAEYDRNMDFAQSCKKAKRQYDEILATLASLNIPAEVFGIECSDYGEEEYYRVRFKSKNSYKDITFGTIEDYHDIIVAQIKHTKEGCAEALKAFLQKRILGYSLKEWERKGEHTDLLHAYLNGGKFSVKVASKVDRTEYRKEKNYLEGTMEYRQYQITKHFYKQYQIDKGIEKRIRDLLTSNTSHSWGANYLCLLREMELLAPCNYITETDVVAILEATRSVTSLRDYYKETSQRIW